MIPTTVIVILAIGGAGGLALFLWLENTFYDLLSIEFAQYYNDWVDDGKPSSWYSPLPGNDGISSQIAASWVRFFWILFTPAWVRASHRSGILLKRMRLIALAQVMLWAVVVAGIVYCAIHLPSTTQQ